MSNEIEQDAVAKLVTATASLGELNEDAVRQIINTASAGLYATVNDPREMWRNHVPMILLQCWHNMPVAYRAAVFFWANQIRATMPEVQLACVEAVVKDLNRKLSAPAAVKPEAGEVNQLLDWDNERRERDGETWNDVMRRIATNAKARFPKLRAKFGDRIVNHWASEKNPLRTGFYVRKGSEGWRVSDGKNSEWWVNKDTPVSILPAASEPVREKGGADHG